jgi:hypothetical protein
MTKRRTDPELRRQIEAAADTGRPITAVFSLGVDPVALPEPVDVEARVASLLKRVGADTGQRPADVQVFGNIGSFAVSAPPEFVARLAQQPEVATATASQPAEDILIRPVRRRSVPGPQPGDGKKTRRNRDSET